MRLRSEKWFEVGTEPTAQHRAALRAMGHLPDAYAGKPIIGIANSWNDLNNCNLPHKHLVEAVKRGVIAAGGFPFEFHTISTAADFMMPSDLLYRNLMAMDVEEMIRAYPVDGVVLLCECDKTCPAQLMAVASANIPSLQLAAGHRSSGWFNGKRITYATDWWQLWDNFQAGKLTDAQWDYIEQNISCSLGGCAVMGTATTMKSISEILGMMLPGTSAIPATHAARTAAAEATGRRIVEMVQEDLRPSHLMTDAAFGNAIMLLGAMGGSTNALIHLTAIAGRLGIPLTLDTFADYLNRVPLLVDLQPSGQANMDDFHHAGGVGAVIYELLPLLNGRCLTATGQSINEVYSQAQTKAPGIIGSLEHPVAQGPTLTILKGNLAPDGAVIKTSACSPELTRHRGQAVVFRDYSDMLARIDQEGVVPNEDAVLVLQNSGPVGVPGMPEWGSLPIPRHLLEKGIRDMVRISDARMSGTGFGTVVLHVAPESAIGGPLALVEDGDEIELDLSHNILTLCVSEEELSRRRAQWRPSASAHHRGYPRLFIDHVLQAPEGCDFDFLRSPTDSLAPFIEPMVGKS